MNLLKQFKLLLICFDMPDILMIFFQESQLSLLSSGEKEFRVNNFCPVAFYRGRLCAIKVIRRKDVEITREIKKELKIMRDLHHDNLVAFIGACVEPPNICTLTEYCSRGSLKDILENDDFHLDKMFVASLVDDLIRGMIFLHDSPIRSHGNLKTSNCLVNSRWVLKISDFGLYDLDISGDSSADKSEEVNEGELYRAPELLRNLSRNRSGTQPGDVYSFAMILYEIHSRGKLYDDYGLSITDILERIKVAGKHGQPLRPRLERIMNAPNFVLQTIRECWNEDPMLRPDFKTIRVKLRPLKKGMKANIFDNMLAMMEKYANNLELLVDERTEMLIEEKQKTDSLLYEMLPRFVADQLKKGMKVQAESYDAVTIYFSDIVGFTDMSAHSTPLQVVDFLNDLYTCFDSIIGFYDVYKVETIGDAYMVVSGLPVRNGEQHAAEIASMSLHLLQAVKHFKIRHRPTDMLMLRIGIHTGPVCAGVVGLKMPRYCLFGDTVNTASRMESTGVPLKVHCSSECKLLLDKLGGYQFERRGPVKMKGKGEKLTYWLIGQEAECRTHSVHLINSPSQNCSSEPQLSTLARNRQSFRRGIVNLTLEACLSDDQFSCDMTTLAVPNDDSHRRTSAPFIFGISGESTVTPKKTIFCWKNEKSKNKRRYDHSPLLLPKKGNCI
ncbi:hypothetical protein QYM36_009141 [Artemia franciscana]|uniref:Guanylate cyclase n=1 Tax=Artemia franciscana TaxID=6661 RepID=A0AA88HN21_ARTSF|nr:hypothetical protein QYM36_009141 [Artemia franciscana]